jgi:hypothetical protein
MTRIGVGTYARTRTKPGKSDAAAGP